MEGTIQAQAGLTAVAQICNEHNSAECAPPCAPDHESRISHLERENRLLRAAIVELSETMNRRFDDVHSRCSDTEIFVGNKPKPVMADNYDPRFDRGTVR